MKEVSNIRDVQRLEYNILCYVVDFFEEYNISYLLSGGTLLGAIRHNGFIPWDDDIDIRVPRDDYERFKEMVRNGMFQSDVLKARLPGDEGYRYPFIKVVDTRTKAMEGLAATPANVWIDIFPFDHYPDNKINYYRCFLGVKLRDLLLTGRIVFGSRNHPLHKRIAATVLSAVCELLGGAEKVAKVIDRRGLKMNQKYRNSHHCGDGAWPVGTQDYFLEKWLFPAAKRKFEGREFNVPCGHHEYLTQFYGDYMTPPPEERRVLQHQLKVWWLLEEDMDEAVVSLSE